MRITQGKFRSLPQRNNEIKPLSLTDVRLESSARDEISPGGRSVGTPLSRRTMPQLLDRASTAAIGPVHHLRLGRARWSPPLSVGGRTGGRLLHSPALLQLTVFGELAIMDSREGSDNGG